MCSHENNDLSQTSAYASLMEDESNVDETSLDDSKFDSTKASNAKTTENHGGKKAKLTFQLTEVESLLFFNIIRFNRRPEEVDWAKVAEHSDLKLKSVKVRFRQILNKHGLSHLMSTPHRKCGDTSVQRRGKRAKNEAGGVAAISQNDGNSQSITSPEQRGPSAGVHQLALPDPQAQLQTPQFGNGVKTEPGHPSPVVNDLEFSPLFALPGPQQQQQQLPATTQGDPANIGPFDPFFDPTVPLGMVPIDTSANGRTNLPMTATAEQLQEGKEPATNQQAAQSLNQSDNVAGGQQMGDSNNMAGMVGTSGMCGNPNDQSTQMNNQSTANSHGTKRYIKFKFVDDPRPYLGDPRIKAYYSHAHGKWRVETTTHIDQDLDSDYDI